MNKIPFSVYDYFGYLSSGIIFMVVLDYIIGKKWVMLEEVPVGLWVIGIIVAYIIGQIIANPAAWLFERIIVNTWLKSPTENLLGKAPVIFISKVFPGYFTPFPKEIQDKVMQKAKAQGISRPGSALFIQAFSQVKNKEDVMARLNTFLNLYGFCRNISFVCLLAFLMLIAASRGNMDMLIWSFVALGGSIGLFYRYLKFFRQYAYELFIAYLELSPASPKKTA